MRFFKRWSKKSKIVFIIAISLGILGFSGSMGYYFWQNPRFSETREPERFFWLRWSSEAQTTLENNSDIIDMISPTWYSLSENGSLIKSSDWDSQANSEHDQVLNICHNKNIETHPMISGGSVEAMIILLSNNTIQTQFINDLLNEYSYYNYTGFNIDFEGIPEQYREDFTDFYRNLKTNLDLNTQNIQLSIAVPAKTSGTSIGWTGWCDYNEIGKISDMVMIMTYDAHGGWSEPGEVAPISWVKRVLAYSVRTIPLEKLFIGIPRYGYDWSSDENWENWGYGYDYFQDRIERYEGTQTRTTDGFEIKYEYTDEEGYSHIAYFCDSETTIQKENFLSAYPIGGYCYWYLTSGDPTYFDKVHL